MDGEDIELQLGDIIRIISPTNKDYHNNEFFIDYIDEKIIVIINDKDTYELTIEDGSFTDESIQSIDILSRSKYDSYVRQNGIETGDYISVYFSGKKPYILNGIVTNIDEDMIEISRDGDDEKFYIDFSYQGVPRNLNIERIIVKKEETKEVSSVEKEQEEEYVSEEKVQEEDVSEEKEDVSEEKEESYSENAIEYDEYDDDGSYTKEELDINEILKKSGVLMFGDVLDTVTQKYNVTDKQTRYGIDVQTNDMFNTMKADEDIKKTDSNLNQIVQRFKQLRSEFSTFNNDGNIDGIIKYDSKYKPIIELIKNMERNISWIIPIVEQRKYIYIEENNIDVEYANDVVTFDNSNFYDETSLINSPKNFKSTADINGYYDYLQKIHNYLIPYMNTENTNTYDINIVNSSIDAMIDNHSDMGMTTLNKNDIGTYKYGIQRYLPQLEKKQLVEMKNKLFTHTKIDKYGPSELLQLKSIVTLPTDSVLYERLYTHSTSIKERVNISNTPFIKSFFMKNGNKKDKYVNNIVTSFENSNDHKKRFFETATNHIVDTETSSWDLNKTELYDKFFDYIIPSIKEIFHLHKSNMSNIFSLNELFKHLEVFNINKSHITFKQYENFSMFINEQLKNYNANREKRKIEFSQYKRKINSNKFVKNKNDIEKQLDLIFDNEIDTHSIHEKINMVSKYNNLIYLTIDKKNLNLNSTKNINESLEYFIGKLDKIKKGDNDCDDVLIVAKDYYSTEIIKNDDDTDIYYDKNYDNTIYDLLDVYKNEQLTMGPSEFKKFLKEKLQEVNGLNDEDAEYDAETLIEGKKMIKDGVYAIVHDTQEDLDDDTPIDYLFYKRINKKWILDNKKTQEHKKDAAMIIQDGASFVCNFKKECIRKDEECGPLDNITNETKKELVKRMMGEFEHRFYMEKSELIKFLDESIMNFESKRTRIEQLIELEQRKYVNYYNMIASQYQEDEIPDKSPYLDALEIILGIQDFVLKQEQILKFSNTFTREPTEREKMHENNKYWRYCIETNTKLMPMFLHRLAHAYFMGNYRVVLDDVIREQGKISDDGDTIIDEYSGKIIRLRELSSGDGDYNDMGVKFIKEKEKKVSSELDTEALHIQEELDDETEAFDNSEQREDGDIIEYSESSIKQKCEDIIGLVSKKMKININNETNSFVLYHSMNTYTKYFGKTVKDTTETVKLLFLTCSSLFIGIQLAQTRNNKSYPGCVVSFDGYPLFENGGNDGIVYMACCISKISKEKLKSNVFKIIKNVNETLISKKLSENIQLFFMTNIDIQIAIKEKQKMIEQNMEIVSNMPKFVFLPSLYDSNVKIVKTLTSTFYDDMKSKLSSNKDNVYVFLNQLKSKNIEIGHIFVKIINDNLKKTDLLLTKFDEPYTENTCCLETYNNTNILDYFNKKDSALFKYAEMAKTNSELCYDFKEKFKSKTLASKRTQISIPPFIQTHFSDDTIYRSFIHYCKWNKTSNMFSLKGDIYDICEIENDGFLEVKTIAEKMKVLKDSGKTLNNSMLLVLMNKINKMNKVSFEPPIVTQNNIDIYTSFINLKEEHNYISKIRPVILDLTNRFEMSMKKTERTKESFVAVSLLEEETKKHANNILDFIRDYSVFTVKENRTIMEFINKFHDYDTNKSLIFDEDVYLNKIRIYKNMIYELVHTIPNLIKNSIEHYDEINEKTTKKGIKLIPSYWNLSLTHMKDITKINNIYYGWMKMFHKKENLNSIFEENREKNIDIFHLSELTPVYSPKIKNDKITYHLFDDVTVTSLFKYYIFSIFDGYITNLKSTSYTIEETIPTYKVVSEYIKNSIIHLSGMKDMVNNNHEFVMKKILHFKEKEKLKITEKFESLSDEQREIENELKNNKLGEKWGKGLEAGLIKYDPMVYERERGEDENINNIFDDIGDNEAYVMDDMDEVNDMSHMDDDDGMTSYDEY